MVLHKSRNLFQFVSVLLSASVERVGVSRMQNFFIAFQRKEIIKCVYNVLKFNTYYKKKNKNLVICLPQWGHKKLLDLWRQWKFSSELDLLSVLESFWFHLSVSLDKQLELPASPHKQREEPAGCPKQQELSTIVTNSQKQMPVYYLLVVKNRLNYLLVVLSNQN